MRKSSFEGFVESASGMGMYTFASFCTRPVYSFVKGKLNGLRMLSVSTCLESNTGPEVEEDGEERNKEGTSKACSVPVTTPLL